MPPKLALAICVIFVIVLLKITMRKTDGFSHAIWIPNLWMLYCGSRPIGQWLYTGKLSGVSNVYAGSFYDRIVLSMIILFAVIVLAKRKISWANVVKENIWLIVLILYAGISIFWSDYTMISFKRWIRLLGIVVCGMVVMSEQEPLRAFLVIIRRTAYVLIPFSIVLIKYFPKYGVTYGYWGGGRMPVGVCMQKNGLGLLCVVSAFFIFGDLLKKRRLKMLTYDKLGTIADIFILLMTVYLLKGGDTNVYSATSIGILLIGMCTMFLLTKMRAHPERITSLISVAVIGGAIILIGAKIVLNWSPVGLLAESLGRNATLTGRTEIWAEVFKIAPRWSFLGTGFGGFWGLPYTFIPIGQDSGHNGYLDVYVELGFVGIILLLIFLFKLLGRLNIEVQHNFDWGILGICLFFMSIAYNYTESDFFSVTSLLWTDLVFMTLVLSGAAKDKPTIRSDSSSFDAHVVSLTQNKR